MKKKVGLLFSIIACAFVLALGSFIINKENRGQAKIDTGMGGACSGSAFCETIIDDGGGSSSGGEYYVAIYRYDTSTGSLVQVAKWSTYVYLSSGESSKTATVTLGTATWSTTTDCTTTSYSSTHYYNNLCSGSSCNGIYVYTNSYNSGSTYSWTVMSGSTGGGISLYVTSPGVTIGNGVFNTNSGKTDYSITESNGVCKYTLNYNVNGGSGTFASVTYPTSGYTTETSHTFVLSTTSPTKSKTIVDCTSTTWEFSNWNTEMNGTGNQYLAGGRFTITHGTSATTSKTLYAQYSIGTSLGRCSYSVSYNANGGNYTPDKQIVSASSDINQIFILASSVSMLRSNSSSYQSGCNKVHKEYTFKNWNTEANGSGTAYGAGSLLQLQYSGSRTISVTLYAQWNETEVVDVENYYCFNYKLSYNANGGESTPDTLNSGWIEENEYIFVVADGINRINSENYKRDCDLVYAKYTFMGWNTNIYGSGDWYYPGDEYTISGSSAATESAVLYAQWECEIIIVDEGIYCYYYKLQYNANGGPSVPNTQEYGWTNDSTHSFVVASGISRDSSGAHQNGCHSAYTVYTFMGWNTKADGTGVNYPVGESYLEVGALGQVVTAILYANWSVTEVIVDEGIYCYYYKLQYNANGGSSTPAIQEYGWTSDSTHSFAVASGISRNNLFNQQDNCNLVHYNFNFLSWNTKADGTGHSYNPSDFLEEKGIQGQIVTITLYAQWDGSDPIVDVYNYYCYYYTLNYSLLKNDGTSYVLSSQSKPLPTTQEYGWTQSKNREFFIDPRELYIQGYVFVGWKLKTSDLTIQYPPNPKQQYKITISSLSSENANLTVDNSTYHRYDCTIYAVFDSLQSILQGLNLTIDTLTVKNLSAPELSISSKNVNLTSGNSAISKLIAGGYTKLYWYTTSATKNSTLVNSKDVESYSMELLLNDIDDISKLVSASGQSGERKFILSFAYVKDGNIIRNSESIVSSDSVSTSAGQTVANEVVELAAPVELITVALPSKTISNTYSILIILSAIAMAITLAAVYCMLIKAKKRI